MMERRLFYSFADILGYPKPQLIEAARECERLAPRDNPKAIALLHKFRLLVEKTPLGRLEEMYSGTFDLDPTCHPYVGYHLFGESYKRSIFMVQLKERYRTHGFAVDDNELPDHLTVLLRFLATSGETTLAAEIIAEAMIPALERMTGKAKSAGYEEEAVPSLNEVEAPPCLAFAEAPRQPSEGTGKRPKNQPYRGVLEALRLVLLESSPAAADPLTALSNQDQELAGQGQVSDRRG